MSPASVRTGAGRGLLCGLVAAAVAGCLRGPARSEQGAPRPAGTEAAFSRRTGPAGIRFRHDPGLSGRHFFPEVMGGGCAFVDLTGDGLPDIYLVNGAPLAGPGPGAGNRLFVNRGDGTFEDATEKAGLRGEGYGIGCCAGDYDNDGHTDLYVTYLGRNRLYRNNGDGTFRDVTGTAGVAAPGFSAGAAFADYDHDGYLDLYVAAYVRWDSSGDVPCYQEADGGRVPVYCRPSVYPPADGTLYRNNGDGTFTDRTRAAGLRVPPGRSLGVIWSDFSDRDRPDLFVANDMSSNFLFANQGTGAFRESALEAGVAVGEDGRPQASMGVAAADYDGDGRLDLACTNFSGEYLALWRNLGGRFEDVSAAAGTVEPSAPYVGFGLGFPDVNLDGWPDLFAVNGHVTEAAERFHPDVTFAQPKLCLLNDGRGRFQPSRGAGPGVTDPRVGRGAAFADYDRDGRVDVLVGNWKDEPDLLRNETAHAGHWLRVLLEGRRCNRSAIGARVRVTAGGRTQVQEVTSGGSYCSQNELALTFGLGPDDAVERVEVRWPGGDTDSWTDLRAGREYRLRQGDGS